MLQHLKAFLLKHEGIIILLSLVVLLRIPNLHEPYWYGDEAIYLTLGHALSSGLTLYSQIIDHKTPLIYVLAMVPSQFWFKLELMIWSLGSVALFYTITKKLMSSHTMQFFITLIFLLLTTLPAFEGNIANGELFVMGFILLGLFFFTKTSFFETYIKEKHIFAQKPFFMFATGICFSLAALTKIPAIFDVAGIGIMLPIFLLLHREKKIIIKLIKEVIALVIGFFVPIVIVTAYFFTKHAGPDYLQFALLYNFHYTGTFGLPFHYPILLFLFSSVGKLVVTVVGIGIALLLRIKQKISSPVLWMTSWMMLALFSTLLSSRPYPHYFLQAFLPFCLLIGLAIDQWKKPIVGMLVGVQTAMFISILVLLHVGLYPTVSYYQRFFSLVTKRISFEQYRDSFNSLMRDDYAAASLIQRTTSPTDRIFIWGTNPMLYALSQRNPAGRFTVSFHIQDLKAYDETMLSIQQTTPMWMIVMKEERGSFPAFYDYLHTHYVVAQTYPTMTLYRRLF